MYVPCRTKGGGQMMNKKKLFLISSFLLIIVLLVLGYFIFFADESSTLTEDAAKDFVLSNYGGTVSSVSQRDGESGPSYQIIFETDSGVYNIVLNKKTGKVETLIQQSVKDTTDKASLIQEEEAKTLIQEQIKGDLLTIEETNQDSISYYSFIIKTEAKDTAYLLDRETGEIKEDAADGTTEYISKEKAEEIALQEIAGTVSEIDMEEDEDFGLVYELEIEAEGDKEVKMYINAYTGAIESINWDND